MSDDAEKLMWVVAGIILVALAGTLLFTIQLYQHPQPPGDCSKPYDYPICKRAYDVAPAPPAPTPLILLNMTLAAILAVLLTIISYKSTVIHQTELITAAANIVTKQQSVTSTQGTSQQGTMIQGATTTGTAPSENIAPPAATPTAGVDAKTIASSSTTENKITGKK